MSYRWSLPDLIISALVLLAVVLFVVAFVGIAWANSSCSNYCVEQKADYFLVSGQCWCKTSPTTATRRTP